MDTLTNQEFLYRQTPVAYDGTGTLTSIKGNTVSFNQLVHGEFGADYATYWNVYSGTGSVSNGVLTVSNAVGRDGVKLKVAYEMPLVVGHKYYVSLYYTSTVELEVHAVTRNIFLSATNSLTKYSGVFECTSLAGGHTIYDVFPKTSAEVGTFSLKYPQCMDLTSMGIDNLTTTAEVEQWLSTHLGNLEYFGFTLGTLIPFTGTGLKTVGFNQWDEEWEEGDISESTGENVNSNSRWRTTNYISILPFTDYYIKTNYSSVALRGRFYDADKNYIGSSPYGASYLYSDEIFKTPQNAHYMRFSPNNSVFPDHMACVNISNAEKNGTYEPYTSNTLSLPTLTYFPFGEDGIGTAYDELIPNTDVYKRTGIITFDGTQTPTHIGISETECRCFYFVPNIVTFSGTSVVDTGVISNYLPQTSNDNTVVGKAGIHRRTNGTAQICISLGVDSGITSLSDFNSYLSAHPLTIVYPLATTLHNYGVVDLGTLTWTQYQSTSLWFCNELTDIKYVSSNQQLGNGVSNKYVMHIGSGMSADSAKMCIAIDTAQISVNTANSSVQPSGWFLYEKTTSAAPSSIEDTYPVWQNGTEQILPVNGSTPTTSPILCDIDYRGLIPVNVDVEPDGYGTVSGDGEKRYHEQVTLVASPIDEFHRFLHYEDEDGTILSTNSTYTFTVGEEV